MEARFTQPRRCWRGWGDGSALVRTRSGTSCRASGGSSWCCTSGYGGKAAPACPLPRPTVRDRPRRHGLTRDPRPRDGPTKPTSLPFSRASAAILRRRPATRRRMARPSSPVSLGATLSMIEMRRALLLVAVAHHVDHIAIRSAHEEPSHPPRFFRERVNDLVPPPLRLRVRLVNRGADMNRMTES
jgi:hypothetical protein